MTLGAAFFLGVIQGLTEFLPVSSSGHLVLAQSYFQIEASILFDVFLHCATLGAVVVFFWKDILRLRRKEFMLLGVGTVPIVLVGLLMKDLLEAAFSTPLLVGCALLGTGLLNLVSQSILQDTQEASTWRKLQATVVRMLKKQQIFSASTSQALLVGAAQALAVTPGISRSGSTVAAGLLTGMDRASSFRFSFLLGIPAILGATLLELHDVISTGGQFPSLVSVIAGCAAAFVTGLYSLRLLRHLMQRAQLQWFAYYCFAVGLIVIGLQLSPSL